MNVIEKLIRTRKELGLSQKDVADIAGCSAATVSRVEAGDCDSLTYIMQIAGAMDLSLVLLDREAEFRAELEELMQKKADLETEIEMRRKLIADYQHKKKGT